MSSIMLTKGVGLHLITIDTSVQIVLRFFTLSRHVWVWDWLVLSLLLTMLSNVMMLTQL